MPFLTTSTLDPVPEYVERQCAAPRPLYALYERSAIRAGIRASFARTYQPLNTITSDPHAGMTFCRFSCLLQERGAVKPRDRVTVLLFAACLTVPCIFILRQA